MSEIDFAVAFLLTLSVLTYSVLSASRNLSNDFTAFKSERLEESASSLSKQLFEIQDNKSLISDFKKIQVAFIEIGSYPHTETMNITVTPTVNKIHVYDNFLNEIQSTTSSSGSNITASFSLNFLPNEKKYINIFYDDVPSQSIDYTSNVTETNVTSMILSEEEVPVLSQQRCLSLKSLSYQEAKSRFGFSDDFHISECDYGGELPATSSIIAKTIPLLIEEAGGTLYSGSVKLMVW